MTVIGQLATVNLALRSVFGQLRVANGSIGDVIGQWWLRFGSVCQGLFTLRLVKQGIGVVFHGAWNFFSPLWFG